MPFASRDRSSASQYSVCIITTLHLHRDLARFGGLFRFYVASPAKAVRLLSARLLGFRARLARGAFRVVGGSVDGGRKIRGDEPWLPLLSRDLHLVPAVEVAGRNGVGQTIAGVV